MQISDRLTVKIVAKITKTRIYSAANAKLYTATDKVIHDFCLTSSQKFITHKIITHIVKISNTDENRKL